MTVSNEWTPMPMYCPNCGTINIGYQNKECKIRYECKKCKVVLFRTRKTRRKDVIEVYAPKEQVYDY